MRLRSAWLACLTVVSFNSAAVFSADEVVSKKDIEALRGKWARVSVEYVQGTSNKTLRTIKEEVKGSWATFDGEKIVRHETGAGGKLESNTFKVTFEADKDPPRLTLHTKTHKIRYIYEVKGDTLRMCCFGLGEVDGVEVVAWPTMFSTDVDREMFPMLTVYKRAMD